ncbi:hypothetical protein WJX79_006642 [Trebouxia sp. C0005]
MAPKKGKTAAKGKSNKKDNSGAEAKVRVPLQQHLLIVQNYWDTLSTPQRQQLLIIDIKSLEQWAYEVEEKADRQPGMTLQKATARSRGPNLISLLLDGLARLARQIPGPGWKVWRWPRDERRFGKQTQFRMYMHHKYIGDDLAAMLPKGAGVPEIAEALKYRMVKLAKQAKTTDQHLMQKQMTKVLQKYDAVEVMTVLLAAFEEEHHYLYHLVLNPIIKVVRHALPEAKCKTTKTDLHYCDLDKLPVDALSCMCDWLKMALDLFSKTTGAMLLQDGLGEEDMQLTGFCDRDKFSIDAQSTKLQIDPTWFNYLELETEPSCLLKWIYDTVTPPADSCRAWAQTALGPWVPTVEYAHTQLLTALRDMQAWQCMLDDGTKLLRDMLESRLSHKKLGTKHDLSPRRDREKNMQPCELPDHVVVALLKREALFNRARLHTAQIQTRVAKEHLRSVRTKQCQGEPKYERWKAELEAPYKMSQTTATAKQLPRTHAGVVMEHTELVDNFENLGAVLRVHEAKEQEIVLELKLFDEEIKQLSGWAANTLNMANTLEQMIRQAQTDQLHQTAVMLKQAFQTDVRYQLHDDKEDHRVYQLLQTQLSAVEKRQEEGRAVLPFLEAYLLSLTCDDPGTIIGPQLVLPLLQKRLDAKAQEHHEQKLNQKKQEVARLQELAALQSSEQLLLEEEIEKKQAAAKKAKKQKAKTTKQQQKQQQQQQQQQSDSEPGSESASEDLLKAPKAALFAVEPEPMGPEGNSKQDNKVMDLFLCPITQVLMKDPVIAADGHTYERAAMQSWLALHQTSPVTGAALSHAKLVPNVIIRGVIQQQLC